MSQDELRPQGPPTTLRQKMQIAVAVMDFPALTVRVLMRERVGFRALKPSRLSLMAVLLFGLGIAGGDFGHKSTNFAAPSESHYSIAMMLFAVAMLGAGLWQRQMRWRELTRGVKWHTKSPGVSHFERFLPSLADHQVRRFIDPLACAVVGVIVFQFSPLLGLWLIVSAMALHVVEQWTYEQELERFLDTLDGLVESEIQNEEVKHFEARANDPTPKRQRLEESAGIPTGIAPDLERQIQQRKRRVLPPDDLAA